MLYLCIGIISVIYLLFLYKLDAHNIIYNHIHDKSKRWKKLYNVVATQNKNVFNIVWVSLCLITKALYIVALQQLNKSVKQVDKDKYEVTYVIGNRMYKTIVDLNRGPSPILQVSDENDNDLTDQVVCYLGPGADLSNLETLSPSFFNVSKLYFELSDGSEVEIIGESKIYLRINEV